MTRRPEAERFSQIIFYATVLLIGYLAWRIVQPFIGEIAWAGILAICLEPVRRRVAPRLGRNRSALVLTLLVLLLIVLPLLFVGATLVAEVSPALGYLQAQLHNQGGPVAWFHAGWGWLRARVPYLPEEQAVIDGVTASVGGAAQFLASRAGSLLASVAGLAFSLLITLGVLFFLLRDAADFAGAVRRALPFGAEQNARLVKLASELVSASVTATVAIAAIQGLIGGVTFALLGLQGAVLWGVMMFLLAFLPLVGSSLVWAPAAIWLVLSGSLVKGVVLAPDRPRRDGAGGQRRAAAAPGRQDPDEHARPAAEPARRRQRVRLHRDRARPARGRARDGAGRELPGDRERAAGDRRGTARAVCRRRPAAAAASAAEIDAGGATVGSRARAGRRRQTSRSCLPGATQSAPSSSSSARFVGSPPPKPVSEPSAPITRWHGTTIGSGFAPFAAPTARDAAGRPTRRASSAYEIVVP